MSKKIIKVDENVELSVFTKFTKDLGLFQATASIWSMVSNDGNIGELNGTYSHDISDIELGFSINNEKCKYLGFQELYEKLYGKSTFNQFCDDLTTEFEKAYFKQTTYKNK